MQTSKTDLKNTDLANSNLENVDLENVVYVLIEKLHPFIPNGKKTI